MFFIIIAQRFKAFIFFNQNSIMRSKKFHFKDISLRENIFVYLGSSGVVGFPPDEELEAPITSSTNAIFSMVRGSASSVNWSSSYLD